MDREEGERRRGAASGFELFLEKIKEKAGRRLLRLRRIDAGVVWRKLFLCAVSFLLSLGTMYFDARPFGIAFLCAASGDVLSVSLGLLLSSLVMESGGIINLVSVLLTLALRILAVCVIEPPQGRSLREGMFLESVYLRMATAAVGAFLGGFLSLAESGFYVYHLAACITQTVSAPVATALFMPLFDRNEPLLPERESALGKVMGAVSYLTLLFSLTLSASSIEISYFSLFHIVGSALTLYTVRNRGLLWGVLAGAVCGIVGGLECALLYIAAAAACTLFMNISLLASATMVPVCGAVWCALFSDSVSFITLFPSQVCGLVLFCAVALVGDKIAASDDSVALEEAAVKNAPIERMQKMADAFGELAETFLVLARERRRPDEGELRDACDRVCDRVCIKCKNRNLCWNVEYAVTVDMIKCLCGELSRRGYVEPLALPSHIKRRCPHLSQIADGVNAEAVGILRRCLEDDRLSDFAADYKAISLALAQACEEEVRASASNPELEKKIGRLFLEVGIKYSSLTVKGRQRIELVCEGAQLSGARVRALELRERIEAVCGGAMSPLSISGSRGRVRLSTSSRRRFLVDCGAARVAAGAGELCGDIVCTLENDEDKFYCVLCDGMGHGKEAAYIAQGAMSFICRMLGASVSVISTIELLNARLRAERDEMSVGIDILELDLISGRASIYKSGAAPTYLFRDGKLKTIASVGLPVGIFRQTSPVKTDMELVEGDIVFMCSDGVELEARGGGKDDGWLVSLLSELGDGTAAAAGRAVRLSKDRGSADDISAAVIRIKKEDG